MMEDAATVLAGAQFQDPGKRAVLGDPRVEAEAVVVRVVGGRGQGLRLQDVAGHLDTLQVPAVVKAN